MAKTTDREWLFRMALLLMLMAALFAAPAAGGAAKSDERVRARVDRERIGLNESLHLTIEADGALASFSGLDTTPLEKDFRIIGQSTSSTFQLGGGQSRVTKSWLIELEPKHTGRLTIPSLVINGRKTRPLTITVTAAPPAPTPGGAAQPPDAFLEVIPKIEVPAYVQSQITISVKLYLRSGLRLSDVSLEEPDIAKATIIKLGDTRRYSARRYGRDYQVIERRYAIIPEAGTELTIPALHFSARVGGGLGGFFDDDPFFRAFGGRSRRLKAVSPPLKIPLKAIPQDYHGKNWLPARKLTLSEKQAAPETTIKVGEPLTRVITIEALGLSAEQLPELDFPNPDGGKYYSDKPELATGVQNGLLHAVRKQSIAFIPERPGSFVLPEIRIKWWDVVNEKEAEAVLPARAIKVVANPTMPAPVPPAATPAPPRTPNPAGDTGGDKMTAGPAAAGKATTAGKSPANSGLRLWQGLCGLLALVWLLTLGLWLREKRYNRRAASGPEKTREAPRTMTAATLKDIERACRANDPAAARRTLTRWAANRWPAAPPGSLEALTERLAGPDTDRRRKLAELFLELEKALYSPRPGGWNGRDFWQRLKPCLRPPAAPRRSGAETGLPPLYPPRGTH